MFISHTPGSLSFEKHSMLCAERISVQNQLKKTYKAARTPPIPQPNIMAEIIRWKESLDSSHRFPLSHVLHVEVSLFLHFLQYFICFLLAPVISRDDIIIFQASTILLISCSKMHSNQSTHKTIQYNSFLVLIRNLLILFC